MNIPPKLTSEQVRSIYEEHMYDHRFGTFVFAFVDSIEHNRDAQWIEHIKSMQVRFDELLGALEKCKNNAGNPEQVWKISHAILSNEQEAKTEHSNSNEKAAAILKNGAVVTNVYDAYDVGLKEGKQSKKSLTDDEWLNYILCNGTLSDVRISTFVSDTTSEGRRVLLRKDANDLRKLVEAAHEIKEN